MRGYRAVLLIVTAVLAGIGLWLDAAETLEQAAIFAAFQAASLAGAVLAAVWLAARVNHWGLRLLIGLCAFVVWRMAYFPVMVFAGWIATLVDWAVLAAGLPSIIYPSFLLAMGAMHWGAVMVGGVMVLQKKWLWAPFLVAAFVIAVMVSLTAAEDLTLLPDDSVAIAEPVPAVTAPCGNPYFEVLDRPDYGWPERVLIFASGVMYDLIPPTPWATAVKSVLEHAFRDQPKASSAERVREHYLAFRAAHGRIRRAEGAS